MSLTQAFLLAGGTLDQLKTNFGINHRRHRDHPNLISLKYDQIHSPMHEPLVQECRGLILNEEDNWGVIARPFDKFFNYGEPLAADIRWDRSYATEKLDGSLMIFYSYNEGWQVGTSGTPDASGEVEGHPYFNYEDLFWYTFDLQGLEVPGEEHVDFTFMFELTSPFNRVVVNYSEPRLTLIGVRHNRNGEEIGIVGLRDYAGFPCVRSFNLRDLKILLDTFKTMDPLQQEGYVVMDGYFRRVKVKHPGYVALHHLRGNGTPSAKRILELILLGETDEVLVNFPEWKGLFNEIREKLDTLAATLKNQYKAIAHEESQKLFAYGALATPVPSILFSLRKGKIATVEDGFRQMQPQKLIEVLGLQSGRRDESETEVGGHPAHARV